MSSTTYEQIKRLSRRDGQSYREYMALAPQNDPFYSGTKGNRRAAEWFRALWEGFGFTDGAHLRRIHYRLISEKGFRGPDGKPYQNTSRCWAMLCIASKQARYLGLVSPESFVDRRNPAPHIFYDGEVSDNNPNYSIDDVDWNIPGWHPWFAGEDFSFLEPEGSVSGYDYHTGDQPYHVEIWAEKSTMDDILLPFGRDYDANIVTALGYQSITAIIGMCKRVASIRKPTRIFYISDFDPSGDSMPVAVARQAEYWIKQYAEGTDVKLQPLVLTAEQAQEYALPRTPIKSTDKRKAGFERLHDIGATELDALEALHPGELRNILVEAIEPYRDEDIEQELEDAGSEAQDSLDTAISEVWEHYEDSLSELAEHVKEVSARYQVEVEPIRERYQVEMAPLEEKLESYRQAITNDLSELSVDLPYRPEAECEPEDEEDFLFSSERSYADQLGYYKERQGK